jgi:hypothetical protein
VREAIEAVDAAVLYPLVYSPDHNPIELSKLKASCARLQSGQFRTLAKNLLNLACSQRDGVLNFFRCNSESGSSLSDILMRVDVRQGRACRSFEVAHYMASE